MTENNEGHLAAELLEVQRTLGWMDLVIGNITDAVYVVDHEYRLVFANQYFSEMVNIPRVFLFGRKIDEVFKLQSKDDPNKKLLSKKEKTKITEHNNTSTYEWTDNGSHKIFKISSRFIATIKQTVYIAKDITSEYEIAVMQSNFINIASHQLRTPMTAIMMYANMLHDGYAGSIDDEQKMMVKNIVTSSERMISLINDILLISRVQNGEENLKLKDGILSELLVSLENEMKPKLDEKNINFHTDYSVSANKVRCNKFILHEIISNLLTNGIQYTPEAGTVTLQVETTETDVRILVSDTGIGIPDEYISSVYDQFSRAPNAFEVFNEGTGLGLYIVKTMIDQINGTINCDSEIHKGTTFTVTFPI